MFRGRGGGGGRGKTPMIVKLIFFSLLSFKNHEDLYTLKSSKVSPHIALELQKKLCTFFIAIFLIKISIHVVNNNYVHTNNYVELPFALYAQTDLAMFFSRINIGYLYIPQLL